MVVNGDNVGIDANYLDGEGGEIESQLVASAAAGPWVPDTQFRIWIYSAILAVYLGGLSFLLLSPISVPDQFKPLLNSLVGGPKPTLLYGTEVALLFVSAQLGFLIAWYRARCKLDFSGRYRVWPWAVCFLTLATIFRATDLHRQIGSLIDTMQWLPWRGAVVGWLLPLCVANLPLTLLLDRDVRNGRSSLWTLRISGALWLASAYLEVFQPELQSQRWYPQVVALLPLFASATLFVGLWHHARVVAYVCPDPPELNERSAASVILGAVGLALGTIVFWRRAEAAVEEEDDSKPKRRRKKAEVDKAETEEAAAKKKRKAPAKKPATRSKTRKAADEVEEPSAYAAEESTEDAEQPAEEEVVETYSDDYGSSVDEAPVEEVAAEPEPAEEWQEEEDAYTSSNRNRSNRKSKGQEERVDQTHGSAAPAPHMTSKSRSWEEESEQVEVTSTQDYNADMESRDENDDDDGGDGSSGDQMKGLSKRQKRELKKQLRDQERTRRR